MNSQVVVIEHATSTISLRLKCEKLEYNSQSQDEEIHRWLIANSQLLSSASKLIIPVRLGNEDAEYMGLYIGLHIRLTKELGDVRCLPILFITEDSKEEILTNQINNHKEKSGLLLFTKGAYLLSAFLLNEYISKQLLPITETMLADTVIPILNFENSKDPGHQLANEWGAFRLANRSKSPHHYIINTRTHLQTMRLYRFQITQSGYLINLARLYLLTIMLF